MPGAHAVRLTAPSPAARGRARLQACVPRLGGLRKTAAAIAAGAPIAPGERVLTSVRPAGAAPVIATDRALCYQDSPGDRSWSRLGWEDVDQVLWDDDLHALALTRTGYGGPSRVVLRLARHDPLVELARERVTSTTLARAPVLSGGRICGWLAARRPPGSDRVRWVLMLPDASASSDPALRNRVSGAIAALEADLGLTSWRPAEPDEGRRSS
jgi:hypothetical protein